MLPLSSCLSWPMRKGQAVFQFVLFVFQTVCFCLFFPRHLSICYSIPFARQFSLYQSISIFLSVSHLFCFLPFYLILFFSFFLHYISCVSFSFPSSIFYLTYYFSLSFSFLTLCFCLHLMLSSYVNSHSITVSFFYLWA